MTEAVDRYTGEVTTVVQGVMSPVEYVKHRNQMLAVIKDILKPDVHYGIIPGTQKPTLLQPGAQWLCEYFGLSVDFETVEEVKDWANGFFYFKVKATVKHKGVDVFAGSGIGSCNSKEARYSTRWIWGSEVPAGVDKSTLKTKEFKGKNNQTLTKYEWANEQIYDQVNTLEKMAAKRALIGAVLLVTGLSGEFTQDMEDLQGNMPGESPVAVRQDKHTDPQEPRKVPPERTKAAEGVYSDIVDLLNKDEQAGQKLVARMKKQGRIIGEIVDEDTLIKVRDWVVEQLSLEGIRC